MATGGGNTRADRFKCSICLDAYKDPRLLPCTHTFCAVCLRGHVLRSYWANQFQCPMCRATIDIPRNGLDGFQKNYYLERDGSDVEEKKVTKTYCNSHPDEEIKLVCKECNVLLCIICKLKGHEKHQANLLTEEAEDIRNRLLTSVTNEETTQHMRHIATNVKEVELQKEELPSRFDNALKLLRNQTHTLHVAIDEAAYKTEEKMRGRYQEILRKTSEELDTWRSAFDSISSHVQTAKIVLNDDNDIDIIRNGDYLANQIRYELETTKLPEEPEETELYVKGEIDQEAVYAMIGRILKPKPKPKIEDIPAPEIELPKVQTNQQDVKRKRQGQNF